MSFNVRYGTAEDGDHIWDQRPAVFGVQEALDFHWPISRSTARTTNGWAWPAKFNKLTCYFKGFSSNFAHNN